MSLFSNLIGKPRQFVSRDSFESNFSRQSAMTPQTLTELRKHGVSPEKMLRLEFFFYTNSVPKAAALTAALSKLKYQVDHRAAASDKRLQVVTGWTTAFEMQDSTVLAWTQSMCKVGFEHDCEFDGWGTNPQQ